MKKWLSTYINSSLRIICAALFIFAMSGIHAQQLYTTFPSSFKNVHANELLEGSALSPVFSKLRSSKKVKVMLIGDSHTRGNFYPHAVEAQLKDYFPTLDFAYYGINGAWARRFYEPDMIQKVANENPDLVIISFGTNESHGANFNQDTHQQTLTTLTERIKDRCKNAVFLITTPPGSFISKQAGTSTTSRGRRSQTTVKVRNERTEYVARSIVDYGHSHHIAVWDIYTIAGGPTYACINWRDANMMSYDQIHFTVPGYQLQGKLLGDAIYKAYLATASDCGTQTSISQKQSTPQEKKPYDSLNGF